MSRRVPVPVPTALPAALNLLGAAEPAAGTAATQIVVVTATRHALALIDAPASIDIVTPAQIEARGADNVFDAVRVETGLSIQGRTISGRKAINLRGMVSRHTLVLVDGKRIEVIPGPMSVLYGAGALGGVVNVITRKPGERWHVGARVEGSTVNDSRSGDGHRAAVQADGPLGGGLALSVSAADVRRQAVANAADPSLSDLEGRHKRDATLRLQWMLAPGHELTAEHRVGDEERWADARERGGKRRLYRSVTPLDRSHRALGWTWEAGGAQDLRTQLRAYRSTLDVGNSRDNGDVALRPQRLDDRVVEGQVPAVPGEGQLSTGGFEWRRGVPAQRGPARRVGPCRTSGAVPAARSGLAVVGPAVAVADRWPAPRPAQPLRFGVEPEAVPGVAGCTGLDCQGRLWPRLQGPHAEADLGRLSRGRGAVHVQRQCGAGTRNQRRGRSRRGQGRPPCRRTVDAVPQPHNQVRHLIITRYTGTAAERGQHVFENADRATLQGLELAGTLRPQPGWTVGGSWQLLDATDGNRQRLEKRPRHALGLKVDWTAGALRAGARLEHQLGQLLASTTAGQPLQAAPSTTLVSAYAGLDLGHGLDLSLGVNNLGQLDLAQKSPLFVYAEAPRTWRLTLRGRSQVRCTESAVMTSALPLHAAPAAGFDEPFAMLAACHKHVERMLLPLERLATHLAAQGCDTQAADAARDVMCYCDLAAPAHHEDEERHVLPVLRAQGDEAFAAQLEQEHRKLRRRWAALRIRLQQVLSGSWVDGGAQDRALWASFALLHRAHAAAEASLVFPAVQAGPDAQAQRLMGHEMAARCGVS